MTLSARFAFAMVFLVVATTFALSLITYHFVTVAVVPRALDRLATEAALGATEIEAALNGARQDLTVIQGGVTVAQMVAARAKGPVALQADAEIRKSIATRFLSLLKVKPEYVQLRIIGAADGGRELVRADRGGPGGAARIVPDGELRQRGDREYVRRTLSLSPPEVYVSPVVLTNGESPGQPAAPTLQIAVPLPAPDGKPFGVVVIDFGLGPKFDGIKAEIVRDDRVAAVNAAGDYLLDSGLTARTGAGASTPAKIQEDFPDFDDRLRAGASSGVWRDRNGVRSGVGWHSVRVAGSPRMTILVAAPYAALNHGFSAVGRSALAGGAIAVLLALLLAVVIARSLSSPLTQMTRAVQGLSRGEPVQLPSNGGREIAILAAAFAEMSTELRAKQELQTRAHQALVESEQLAQAIIRTALDAFVQTDDTGIVLDWSPQAEALAGWTREEVVGAKLVEMVFPPSLRAAHRERINRFLTEAAGGISGMRYESPALHKDGHEFLVEVSLTALPRGDGWIINAFVRDITRKRLAEEQLIQSQKMESVGQLTGGIAHDFNNMLTVITGTIEILADAVKENPGLSTIAKLISDAADRATKLTANLLAFARKQPLRPIEIDVNALVGEVVELLSPTLGRQISIQTSLSADVWPALVDPAQLSSALVNLAINARDAMPSGGKLTFSTSNRTLGEQEAAAGGVSPGDYVVIEVADTGVGIPSAIRDRIFDPFFSTKQVGTGTGLGLSMVFGFAKQSGGNVEVESEEGNGASFRIFLPKAASEPRQVQRAAAEELRGGSETILCVEDDNEVRAYVTGQLRSLGYKVISASDAAEALAIVEAGTAFDLLFTDIVMPGALNGRQLADKLAERLPQLKVLFTSGNTYGAIPLQDSAERSIPLLAKPYRREELARMLRHCLDQALDPAGDPIPLPYSVLPDVERFLRENPPKPK
jgi:PAS domain S-box-containing protein